MMFPEDDNDRELPTAYGGCQCLCHREPGIIHAFPCCHPEAEAIKSGEYAPRIPKPSKEPGA